MQIRICPPHQYLLFGNPNLPKLLLCDRRLRDLQRPLHSLSLKNCIMPFLDRGPFAQIKLQRVLGSMHPKDAGNIRNGELLSCDIGGDFQTSIENRVKSLGFLKVSLDAPVGAHWGGKGEVMRLA